MNPLDTLACPDCRGELRAVDSTAVLCVACDRPFDIDDGIYLLLPSRTLPDTRADDSPDHRKWREVVAEALEEYFDKGNSLFHRIHHSSHRTIASWLGGLQRHGVVADLGCGAGSHYAYHRDLERVVGIDINLDGLRAIRARYPEALLVQGDIYALPFKPAAIDTVISIYNLEHIFHLDAALDQVREVLSPGGVFAVGLPCEGGLAWNSGRRLTSQRTMSKRYDLDYRQVIAIEHCNTASKVLAALQRRFRAERRTWFPFPFLPSLNLNLTVTSIWRKSG